MGERHSHQHSCWVGWGQEKGEDLRVPGKETGTAYEFHLWKDPCIPKVIALVHFHFLCLPSVTVVTAVHILATIFLYVLVTLEIFTLAFDILYFHYDESLCRFVFTEPSQGSLCFINLKTHFFFKSGKFSTKLCVPSSPSGLCRCSSPAQPLRASVTSPLCFLPYEFSTDFFTGCVNFAV